MLRYWFLAIRPKTLTLAVVPVLVGTALAWRQTGAVLWAVLGAALGGAVLIQAGTNLHNDAADYERGADDRTTRLGPPRVTAEGWLSTSQVRRAAALSFALAVLTGSYLVWVGGWPILVVGLASIAAGLAYTGGPFPVAYSVLGELFVWFFFGLVAVSGTYYLHTGEISGMALITGALMGMPAAAVLVVNNYRDLDNDKAIGKNTLAVRMGRRASRVEYTLLILVPFALLFPLDRLAGGNLALLLPLVFLPLAGMLIRRFITGVPGPGFNQLLVATARFQFGFGLLLCIGLSGACG